MDHECALALAEMRLLQTWHLIRRSMRDHPDQAGVNGTLEAISAARGIIKTLGAP